MEYLATLDLIFKNYNKVSGLQINKNKSEMYPVKISTDTAIVIKGNSNGLHRHGDTLE